MTCPPPPRVLPGPSPEMVTRRSQFEQLPSGISPLLTHTCVSLIETPTATPPHRQARHGEPAAAAPTDLT